MKRTRKGFALFATAWLALAALGSISLYSYGGAAGEAATAPPAWPAEWSIRPADHGITLIVTVHPQCFCSRATLGELARIMTRRESGIAADIIFVGATLDTLKTSELWKSAREIPGVTVLADPDSSMAARLGAKTSGQTYAFDADGKLLFSGGITPARGHMGENPGEDALIAILTRNQPACAGSPVFGCPLTQERP